MSHMQTILPEPVPSTLLSAASAERCGCERPVPTQRAARKGAAATVCLRCGLPVPLRLR